MRAVLQTLSDLRAFLRVRKRYWLLPVILALLVIGALAVWVGSTVVAPFVYTLF